MKTIVAGSRTIRWYGAMEMAVASCPWKITSVVCGRARGPDIFGEHWAALNGLPTHPYTPKWRRDDGSYDPRAGLVRNARMAMDSEALIALWDGESRGTKHMIDCMTEDNKPVHTIIIPRWL